MITKLYLGSKFPFYGISDGIGLEVDIPADVVVEYEAACRIFDAAQAKLHRIYLTARAKKLKENWDAVSGGPVKI